MKAKEQKGPGKYTFVLQNTVECIKVDKQKINFCKYPIFASSSKQISLNLEFIDYFPQSQKRDFRILKIKTVSPDFPTPVFLVKAFEAAEEVEELEIPIKADEPLHLWVKACIPQLEVSSDIQGMLILQLEDLVPMQVPIQCRGEIPLITCSRELLHTTSGVRVIRIISKELMKIPFKNCSNINFFFEAKLISKEPQPSDIYRLRIVGVEQIKGKPKELCIIKVDANSIFLLGIEFELVKKDASIRFIRKILLLQIQGSKLFFPFALQVIITE